MCHGFRSGMCLCTSVTALSRSFSAVSEAKFKVCVSGGAGGIGQPMSMLMAMNPLVKKVSIQDVTMAMVPPSGVVVDFSQLEYPSNVFGFAINLSQPAVDQLEECLTGCHLVLIPAGMPRKPGMTCDHLFGINAGIARWLLEACEKFRPEAMVRVIVNPVNSMVPAMCEHYKKLGLDHRKIVGVTTLDVVRTNEFTSSLTGSSMRDAQIPVIGGHAGVTILPLFSQCPFGQLVPEDQVADLDKCVQDGGTELVLAQATTSFGSCELVDMQLTVVCAESQNKRRERHDSVETLMPTQSNVTSWTKLVVMSNQKQNRVIAASILASSNSGT